MFFILKNVREELSTKVSNLFAKNCKAFSTINKKQMQQFDKIKSWWHPSSEMNVLFQYNYQRIDFLKKIIQKQENLCFQDYQLPFKNKNILDVGCGAGFLSQSLTRLGGNVTGLDPNITSYGQAKSHKSLKQSLQKLKYYNCSIQQYLQKNKHELQSFDIITSMDVIQHVDNPKLFLSQLISGLKIDSYLMISTISRTIQTYLTHILLAQYVTRLVPIGTHHHQKFINSNQLQNMFTSAGIKILGKRQLNYNWKGQFVQKQGGGNYILIGKKIR